MSVVGTTYLLKAFTTYDPDEDPQNDIVYVNAKGTVLKEYYLKYYCV